MEYLLSNPMAVWIVLAVIALFCNAVVLLLPEDAPCGNGSLEFQGADHPAGFYSVKT